MAQGDGVLARITPATRAVPAPRAPVPRALTPRQKAAVIVRFLLAEGASLPLRALPEQMQADLTEEMASLRLVDRATLDAVVRDFLAELDSVGLTLPGEIERALTVMDGHISPSAANRLRRMIATSSRADPWERLVQLPPERLVPPLLEESVEVAAVILSKLPVPRAADLLARLPGERARRIAFAVSMTGNVEPETVRRIGAAIMAEIDRAPPKAFETGPVERVGAILNVSPALTRDEVLRGLEAEDAGFAEQVRRAIFTFAHLPARLAPRDVPKVVRVVDQPTLVTAIAGAAGQAETAHAAEFLLANMSQRMAQTLREGAAERGKVKEKEAEEAMNAVVGAVRQLEGAGELVLIQPDEG
jgi:flagellar motor switch protein FliG